MLGLVAEGVIGHVDLAVLAGDGIEIGAGEEMDGGFGGPAFEEAPGLRVVGLGGLFEFAVGIIEHHGVIVAGRIAGEGGDVLADQLGFGEIEGSSLDGGDFTGGDQGGIDGEIVAGEDFLDIGPHVAGSVAAEIEIAVMREINRRRPVGGGEVLDFEEVGIGEGVEDGDFEVAGKSLGSVGVENGEADGRAVGGHAGFGVPHALGQALESAVQAVGSLVHGDGISRVVDGEHAVGNAIGVAAGDAAHEGAGHFIIFGGIEAEDHVAELAVFVGDEEVGEDGTVIDQAGGAAFVVGQDILRDGRSVADGAEGPGFDGIGAQGGGQNGQGQKGGHLDSAHHRGLLCRVAINTLYRRG